MTPAYDSDRGPAYDSARGPDRGPAPASEHGPNDDPARAREHGPASEHGPAPESDHDPDVERRLRAALARAAHDVTPGPVPLAAVRRRGRAHRRRRAVTFATLAVLSVSGAATVVALSLPGSRGAAGPAAPPALSRTAVAAPSRPAPPVAPPVTAVRVVQPGQRLDVGRGWKVWLTGEGKHWAGPDGYENSRSVTDGNVETSEPGVTYQSEGDQKGTFHSGLYYGTRAAGRVELRYADGRTVPAALLELPGRPGWGVWYVYTPASPGDRVEGPDPTPSVALYDRSGTRLSQLAGR
ncbi:hypothetical protein ACIGO8_15820 [Streptomyces sp. NPDC053493]|uniref:hypothetical protein n=1 Tax=Streptomyces sp. NPDC053493 TaxID=3365705 RepID=UPI0037D503F7